MTNIINESGIYGSRECIHELTSPVNASMVCPGSVNRSHPSSTTPSSHVNSLVRIAEELNVGIASVHRIIAA